MKETRSFSMHPQLLYSVIQRQAGTLSKAILEGIMNAVDAGATVIDIQLTNSRVELQDNGKGFKNKQEIEKFFETFGQPHDPTEQKIYGAFRMGRGQMFAFGSNTWRTGQFEMVVDIKRTGLDYGLTNHDEPYPGCRIEIDLYTALLPSELAETQRDLERMVKYVSVPVKLNGTVISVDPKKEKWDLVTDGAYIRLKDKGSLYVYNLGVLVREFSGYNFGCGGVVVSKQQLKVNFARNDIQSDCPIWKAVRKVVDARSTKENKKKPVLNDDSRQRLADQLRTGDISYEDAYRLKLFTDVTGRHRSARELYGLTGTFPACTVADRGNVFGDKLMQHKLAFVFAQETLDRFEVSTVKSLLKLVRSPWQDEPLDWKVRSLTDLTKALSKDYQLINEKELTPTEQAALEVIRSGTWALSHCLPTEQSSAFQQVRQIHIGRSGVADGWTDGSSYIAINRDFLRGVGQHTLGWIRLGQLILHEYCHTEPDTDSHIHSPEFYQQYHDASEAVGEFVKAAQNRYTKALTDAGKKASKRYLKEQDKIATAERARVRLLGTPTQGVS